MSAALHQKVFFADNTLADVVSGIQSRHVIRLQQHLQAVGGVLLANGEALVRQLPRHIAHDAVVIFLIKRLLQASGIDDQLLHQPLIVVELIEGGGIVLRGVMLQLGEEEVDEVMDGRIEARDVAQIAFIALHLLPIITPLRFPPSGNNQKRNWDLAGCLRLLRHVSPLLYGKILIVQIFFRQQGAELGVLLGLVEKFAVIPKQDLKHPELHHPLTQSHELVVELPPKFPILGSLVLLRKVLHALDVFMDALIVLQ